MVNNLLGKISSFGMNPVILVHGISDTHHKLRFIQRALEMQGLSVYAIDLRPNNGDGKLDILAQQLKDFIDRWVPPTQNIDLIGFSMGGLVSRYYIQRLGGLHRLSRFITISSPHKGTIAAYFSPREGCVQMRPHSDFLQDLNGTMDQLNEVNFVSIWTPFDLIILPPNSSELPVGENIPLPVLTHPLMVRDHRVINRIVNLLS
jgi:triacylglycerol lipase